VDRYNYVPTPLCPKDRTRLRFLYVISYPKPDAIQLECGRCKTPYMMRMTIDRQAIEDLNRAS
jgi:hypothetical protein